MIWSKNSLGTQMHAGRNDFLTRAPFQFITGVKSICGWM